MNRPHPMIKTLIAIIAVVNIAAMMLFEYGLPSLTAEAREQTTAQDVAQFQVSQIGDDVGTIEAVEKEEASKETEAAESAIASPATIETGEEPEESEEERDPDAPLLELTEDHIYLKIGERFNYMSYIKTMEDVDGSDLSRYIHLDRDVNTWEAGEIELTYRITSAITGKSSSKALLISITE